MGLGDDGETASGVYVRTDAGHTVFGHRAILVLHIDGEERSVWINETSLRNRLRDELATRKARDFTIGERVIVRRSSTTRESTTTPGRQVRLVAVRFRDATHDAADLLGVEESQPVEPELPTDPVPTIVPDNTETDIPF